MSSNGLRLSSKAEDGKHDRMPGKHLGSRLANVYDAVAGRVTSRSVCLGEAQPAAADRPPRMKHSFTSTPALAPEEALFRPGTAPDRFAERDIYMAHDRDLSSPAALPDSDLLKATHVYSSHYYSALRDSTSAAPARVGGRGMDENSMDETALLAFGILLEEAGRGILGSHGDLVFTEGLSEPTEASPGDGTVSCRPPRAASRSRRESTASFASPLSSRRRKRQKLTDLDDD